MQQPKRNNMKRFVIERHIPGVGRLGAAQLKDLAAASNDAVASWPERCSGSIRMSAADNTFCVYLGESEDSCANTRASPASRSPA